MSGGGGGGLGPKTLIGAVAGGPVGALFGANMDAGDAAASAAEAAARAQGDAANAWMNNVQRQQQAALDDIKDLTPSQLASYEKSLSMQEANVKRAERLVDSIDPALLEAGKQAQQLLQGQDAQVLTPIRNQRSMERQQLIDSLRQQLGPGAETSQAGLNALNKFDAATSSQVGQAQAGYTQMLLNTSLQAKPNLAGEIGAYSTLGQSLVGAQRDPGLQRAQMRATFTGLGNPAGAAQVNAAGGQFIGDQMRAGQMQQLTGGLIGIGGTVLGGMVGGPGGAAAGGAVGKASTPSTTAGGSYKSFGTYA